MRRRKRSRNKKIILGVFISLICLMSVGYAAFNTNLNITAKGNLGKLDKELTIQKLKDKYCNVTTGEGLYKDIYENGRCVYKGNNPNNYITFNNEEAGWRIIAIEADGTIKIMRKSQLLSKSFDSRDNRTTGYCASDDSQVCGCNVWAKTDNFINGNISGPVEMDSEANIYLNTEYYNTLDSTAKTQIQEHEFGYGPTDIVEKDLLTLINLEKKYLWTGNIGLIETSDYIMANSNIEQCGSAYLLGRNSAICKTTNYMFNMSWWYWTINPAINSSFHHWHVVRDGSGTFGSYYGACDRGGYVPVLYLKGDIILSGWGTIDNPYKIVNK